MLKDQKKLRAARLKARLTQAELARRLRVSGPYLSDVERCQRTIQPSRAIAWLRECGVETPWLKKEGQDVQEEA